ncbi:glucosaminidase domain-containing protein [Thalassomonas actiniarum]|uniref:Glucosaminidase domain-containing protein n=1 Tax=Thalassomonas actiniarum TaxID=485447 RepID=A0AAE9YPQ3_9GAMM|nr:glucosaminidase domain-containing protein [Thalassomonas actiniarum]WDD97271.1 glucosaminidase domain-containing protein [Thalassomonas actiniarum]
MKGLLIVKVLFLAMFAAVLLAPFTFLKPVTSVPVITEEQIPPEVVVPQVEQARHNVHLPDFAAISDVKEKKRQFFDFLRPAIIKENNRLNDIRNQLLALKVKLAMGAELGSQGSELLVDVGNKYRIDRKLSLKAQVDELLLRVDLMPVSLVLVQAANESAWGTSRFARIGLNFFGLWCYRPSCGMVPNGRISGATHEVAAFTSIDQAVQRYIHNINTNAAYDVFRSIRAQLRLEKQPLRPEILATGLVPYSERGSDYVLELTNMIRHNQSYLEPAEAD